jgi:teichuronic acid biosynthesis glycosyltransferase TuaG
MNQFEVKTGVFSIIMPAYNSAKTIEQSIRSVISQSETNWELLVADDCSKDQTAQIVQTFAQLDSRIKLFRPEINAGAAGARNLALTKACGQYICFLDSDDWWLPGMLAQHKRQFEQGAKVSFTSYSRVTEDGKTSVVTAPLIVKPWLMNFINPIGNLTGAYDRQLLGIEMQQLVRHEDYLMWFNLVKRAGLARGTKTNLACYRVASGSLSGNKLKAATWHWNLLRGPFRLSFIFSVFAFCVYCAWSVFLRIRERIANV